MTDKEIRRLSKKDLLQLYVSREEEYNKLLDDHESLTTEYNQIQIDYEELENQVSKQKKEFLDAQDKLNKVKETSDQLDEKMKTYEADHNDIDLQDAKTIAEASLKINHVFESVQKASDEYLKSIKELVERQDEALENRDKENRDACIKYLMDTKNESKNLITETEAKCKEMLEASNKKCEDLRKAAKEDPAIYRESMSNKVNEFIESHEGFMDILNFYNMEIPTFDEKEES